MAKKKDNTLLYVGLGAAALFIISKANANPTVSGVGNEREIKRARKENDLVSKFIKNFQANNEYKPESLTEYNAKFNKEFKHFLNNSNFSKDTIELFHIK